MKKQTPKINFKRITLILMIILIILLAAFFILNSYNQKKGPCKDSVNGPALFFLPWQKLGQDYYAYQGCVFYSSTGAGHLLELGTDSGPKKVVDADIETFQVISKEYAKDKSNIYIFHDILSQADYETFRINEQGRAEDKNGCYSYEESVSCNYWD